MLIQLPDTQLDSGTGGAPGASTRGGGAFQWPGIQLHSPSPISHAQYPRAQVQPMFGGSPGVSLSGGGPALGGFQCPPTHTQRPSPGVYTHSPGTHVAPAALGGRGDSCLGGGRGGGGVEPRALMRTLAWALASTAWRAAIDAASSAFASMSS